MLIDFSHLNFSPPNNHKRIIETLPNITGKTILDIGCGLGDFGYRLKTRKGNNFTLSGLDKNVEYLNRIPGSVYDHLWVQDLEQNQNIPSYDVKICVEVIEHLSKESGHRLLGNLVKDGLSIVTTPEGYMKSKYHLSGWARGEFEDYGFQTKVVNYLSLPRSLVPFDVARRAITGSWNGKLIIAHFC